MVNINETSRRRRPRTSAAGAAGLLLLALVVPGGAAPVAALTPGVPALGSTTVVDRPSSYDAQTTCRKTPRPGTVALAAWLQKTYPATGSLGMIRACGTGGTSEHKDGRAFDWAADVKKPKAKKAAYDFIRKALATDAAGNQHALARRMGIMYFIYNDTIWSSYRGFTPRPYLNSGCKTKKKCDRNLRHKNHVHISLGFAGAAAQTSWYRARGVKSVPVHFAGTSELDPDSTAVTGLTAPATGATVASTYYLRKGVTYRFVATGTVKYGAGLVGDANCTAGTPDWTATDRLPVSSVSARWLSTGKQLGWHPGGGNSSSGSDHDDSPYALPLPTSHGLVVAGGLMWGTECRADHTYEAWYTPPTRQKLTVKYVDLPAGDNTGNLSLYVARDDITAASLARK
ncbi:hypothetical protein ABIE44_001921 [Marmoricola sp. OAE513]|uniref:hypothetical protein n=1 Tax=Marmoricola sp. OAE513 TaxID=2817894 RepID=UPI001AE90282